MHDALGLVYFPIEVTHLKGPRSAPLHAYGSTSENVAASRRRIRHI